MEFLDTISKIICNIYNYVLVSVSLSSLTSMLSSSTSKKPSSLSSFREEVRDECLRNMGLES